jgi:F-type H+-transporting ATPase subunit epsilon
MKTFSLSLRDPAHRKDVAGVASFIGQDAGGHFGIQAHHERMLTTLVYGLARYRTADEQWHYVILPGGVLYFLDNVLQLATRRFFEDDDLGRILGDLDRQLRAEEEELGALKENLRHLELEMLRRMYRMGLERMEGR